MSARTCNRKPCELTQFETTWRMALPAARASCRACHVRFRHDVEPEERFKPNRNTYHAVVAARTRRCGCANTPLWLREHAVVAARTRRCGCAKTIVFGQSLERCPESSIVGF